MVLEIIVRTIAIVPALFSETHHTITAMSYFRKGIRELGATSADQNQLTDECERWNNSGPCPAKMCLEWAGKNLEKARES
jgi:hypothetical protein